MNSRYYVFPDIHGMKDLLLEALAFVYEHNPEGGKIIFLGDYIDRGPDSVGVCDIVMNPPENWEFIALRGNHEQMLIDAFNRRHFYYDWKCVNQFISTLRMPDYIEWMETLPLVHFEDDNVFAHAWWEEGIEDENVLWQRSDDFISGPPNKYLVHGHTPRGHGPCETTRRTNLDCGAVFYGRFVIAEMQPGKMGPVSYHVFGQEKD